MTVVDKFDEGEFIKDIQEGQFENALEKLNHLDESKYPMRTRGKIMSLKSECLEKLGRHFEALELKQDAINGNPEIDSVESSKDEFLRIKKVLKYQSDY
jgi:tetratricopeptide (TPR) repeat protein